MNPAVTLELPLSKPSSLWLSNARYDLLFFHLSGLICLLLVIPYRIFGESAIFPIYYFYLIFFGVPHNFLTWATLMPNNSRATFRMEPILNAAIVCLIISLLIPLTNGTSMNDWILSLISYLSLWHAYRQHHGICKMYDSIQAKRFKDPTIFQDRKWMNLFFGLGANGVLVWAFTHEGIRYLLSADESYLFIGPLIPWHIFQIYCVATLITGLLAFNQSVIARWRAGKFIPWPQISLMLIAIGTYVIPYFFIPITAIPLAVAIATIYHNIQYFGFVWLFERSRMSELEKLPMAMALPQKLVKAGKWEKYYGCGLAYTLLIGVSFMILPRQVSLTLVYFVSVAHYVIDGYIWKRENNSLLAPAFSKI